MAVLPALRHIACVAAINGTVQGVLGVLLSILALCVCFCALGTQPVTVTNSNDFAQYLTYYLQGTECGGTDYQLYNGVTSATALRVWMALSLFFSASMMISSIVLVVAVSKRWSDEKLQITLVSWLFINTFTAVDDLILGYVFGSDYLRALDLAQAYNVGSLSLAVVTFLSVRGIYLWILNLTFIIYLLAGARSLHKHLNEQIPSLDQEPIESWPTLDDFGKIKGMDIDRTPTAVNPNMANRLDNGGRTAYPEHSALARWPTLNGQAQSLREPRQPRDQEERRSKTMRESSFRRQQGVDNPGYEDDRTFYLRLQSETGSTRDYEEMSTGDRRRSSTRDLPRNQERMRREVSDSAIGQYKQKTPDPWRESPIPPPPSDNYLEENGVHIPPVDYLDPPPNTDNRSVSGSTGKSLQEAILDRTLRLKKVPDELKKGFQKY